MAQTKLENVEFTSYIMAVSYGIENAWIKGGLKQEEIDVTNIKSQGMKIIERFITQELKSLSNRSGLPEVTYISPDKLQYLYSHHDFITGMTGVAYLDVASQEIIIGYVGTNPSNDGWRDILLADGIGIGLSTGAHYPATL